MADVALAPTPAEAPPDPGTRGTLTVADRAVQRVAAVAAARVPGVARTTAGGLLGRDLPHASAHVVGTRAQVEVDVALVWPAPAAVTARAVREAVAAAVERFAGVPTDRVDVRVVAVTDPSDAPRERVR
ncbi:Asp23/Gls24 family envelope stress response protein [Cellulomonas sp. HD19AZ1]|uniref:Asp23/Gls24 family envelope stress response protein n=1 Tax=Cellulomonas sp. HD19AZ1 TaxID=2559593 RepID=UPI00107092C4|nr:Asp23/Gls24 family envelope stress response protein [Cellulomonas sp. HD19AZ1]TFH71358.1 Asp23/Gls24 family envelope stress response protein [Cellulomonas sp. HD19AZ1]